MLAQNSVHSGPSAMVSHSTTGPACSGSPRAPLRFLRPWTRCLIVPSTTPLPIAWPRRRRAACPIRAGLGGLWQGVVQQVAAGVEGMALAGVEDWAVGGGLGQGAHLGDESDGALDGDALWLTPILEGSSRQNRASLPDVRRFVCLIPDSRAYFQRHTLDGYLTAGARRLACRAGLRDSFARAEKLLTELAHWELDDETIRRLCHADWWTARSGTPSGTTDRQNPKGRPCRFRVVLFRGRFVVSSARW